MSGTGNPGISKKRIRSTEVTTASFRDPAGRVFFLDDRVFRIVKPDAFAILQSFLSTPAAQNLLEGHQLVRTTVIDSTERQDLSHLLVSGQQGAEWISGDIVEHERIPFTTYPYEWPAQMLCAAAQLTLDIAQAVAPHNWRLKDATPYNVLFVGPKPVFVDVLSFEPDDHTDMVWLAHGQFVRTFLLPLLAWKHFHLHLRDLLLTRRDGLQPEDLYALCSRTQRFLPPIFSMVSVPTWLTRAKTSRVLSRSKTTNGDKASFIYRSLLRRLSRTLKSVSPDEERSRWSTYSETLTKDVYYSEKLAFIQEAVEEYRPKTGLDIGCNTGDFSSLAAQRGVSMVSIDSDPVVVGRTWHRARKENLDILPLVIDIARPSPEVGWFNNECASFLSRGHQRFEIVFLLAAMHHIAKDGIPLGEILRMVRHFTQDLAIIEFLAREDEQFLDIAAGREEVFASFNVEQFEKECQVYFQIVRRKQVRSARWLYLVKCVASSSR